MGHHEAASNALSRAPVTRYPLPALVLFAALALMGGANAVLAAAGDRIGVAEEPLAIVNARSGTFTETPDGYRLKLDGVTPRAVWFSDRPGRATGTYSITELEQVFFADGDPPNAALEVFAGRAAGDVLIVEVSNPRYRAGSARLVLDARVLSRDEIRAGGLAEHRERATSGVPARFGPAALFLDDSCSVNGGEVALTDLTGVTCEEATAIYGDFGDGGDCPDQRTIDDVPWLCNITGGSEYQTLDFRSQSGAMQFTAF